jgi:hypothetical protein
MQSGTPSSFTRQAEQDAHITHRLRYRVRVRLVIVSLVSLVSALYACADYYRHSLKPPVGVIDFSMYHVAAHALSLSTFFLLVPIVWVYSSACSLSRRDEMASDGVAPSRSAPSVRGQRLLAPARTWSTEQRVNTLQLRRRRFFL